MMIPDEVLTSPSKPGKPSTPGKSSTPGRISKRPRVKPVKLEATYKELLPALPDKIFSENDSDSDKEDKIWKTGQ